MGLPLKSVSKLPWQTPPPCKPTNLPASRASLLVAEKPAGRDSPLLAGDSRVGRERQGGSHRPAEAERSPPHVPPSARGLRGLLRLGEAGGRVGPWGAAGRKRTVACGSAASRLGARKRRKRKKKEECAAVPEEPQLRSSAPAWRKRGQRQPEPRRLFALAHRAEKREEEEEQEAGGPPAPRLAGDSRAARRCLRSSSTSPSSMDGMKKKWNLEHVRLICACLLCLIFTEESKTESGKYSETYCMFQDRKYRVGTKWKPYLEPHGIIPCLDCFCSERRNVLCMKVKCETLRCSSPIHDSSECCPKCPDEPVAAISLGTIGKPCNYSGIIYQHEEMFVIEGIFRDKQPNQCEQCSCSEGEVYCALKTCPKLTCTSPVSGTDSCCQVCKDEESPRDLDYDLLRQPANREVRHSPPSRPESSTSSPRLANIILRQAAGGDHDRPLPNYSQKSGTIVHIILNNQQKVGEVCISNGKTYSQGEIWHPFLPIYGTVECVLCTCNGTKPECKAIKCPHQYPCEQPKKIEGKCCKVCPEEMQSELSDDQDYFCGEKIFPVYEAVLNTSKITVQKKVAFQKNETSRVEIYTWIFKRGLLSDVNIEVMPKEEFRELPYFVQITKTTLNMWKIFSEGAAHLIQMCGNRECRTEVEELIKDLHLGEESC
ncbi:chordin-like protein 1 [Vipera latastei]